MVRFRALLVLLCLALPAPAAAAPDLFGGEEARSHLARAIAEGAPVRITSGTVRVELFSPALEGDAVTYAVDDRGRRGRIGLDAVDRIERRGSAWRRGALGGAIVGTGAATILLIAISQDDFFDTDVAGGALLILAGAAAGGTLGAIVAAPAQVWRTVYRAGDTRTGLRLTPGKDGPGAGVLVTRSF